MMVLSNALNGMLSSSNSSSVLCMSTHHNYAKYDEDENDGYEDADDEGDEDDDANENDEDEVAD